MVKASFSEITAMYMDDGKVRCPASFSWEQAVVQFGAVLEFLPSMGSSSRRRNQFGLLQQEIMWECTWTQQIVWRACSKARL